jgi:hypothetical protein
MSDHSLGGGVNGCAKVDFGRGSSHRRTKRGGKRKTERDSTIIEKKYKRRRETVDPHNRVRKYVE